MDRTSCCALATILAIASIILGQPGILPAAEPPSSREAAATDKEASADNPASTGKPAAADKVAELPKNDWPLYRGGPLAQGVSATDLPVRPEVIWKRSFENESFESTPIIQDGRIYIGGLDGPVYALELATGKTVWKFETEAGVKAAPAYRDGKLYVGDLDGRFYCLDAATGKQLWGYETNAEIDSGANFFGDRVIVGSQDATLYCLDANTGKEVWQHQINDQIRCFPTIVGDRCFLAGCDGELHVITLEKGERIGAVPIEAPTGCTPAVLGDMLYFGTEGESFLAVNWKDLEVAWKYRHPQRRFAYRSSAAVTQDAVVVGNQGKMLLALDPATGKQLWAYNTRTGIQCSPVITTSAEFPAGVAYSGTTRGVLFGVSVKDGKQVWEYEAGGGFIGSPAVASQRMVIGSTDGTLYCFGAK